MPSTKCMTSTARCTPITIPPRGARSAARAVNATATADLSRRTTDMAFLFLITFTVGVIAGQVLMILTDRVLG